MALIGITAEQISQSATDLRQIAETLDRAAAAMTKAGVESLDLQFVYYGTNMVQKMLGWADGIEVDVRAGIRAAGTAKKAAEKADAGQPIEAPPIPFPGPPQKAEGKTGRKGKS